MMIKDSQLKYMTLNEIRSLDDLKPLEFGDMLYDQAKNFQILATNILEENNTQENTQKSNHEEIQIWKSLDLPKIDKDFDENKGMFVAPKSVAKIAQEALDAKKEHGDKVKGGLAVGWTRARQLANQEPISYKTIKRMFSFFSRHAGDEKVKPENKDFPYADNGFTAHAIWGGDEGFEWCKQVIAHVEDELEKLSEENE
jgi:hypothetical protein